MADRISNAPRDPVRDAEIARAAEIYVAARRRNSPRLPLPVTAGLYRDLEAKVDLPVRSTASAVERGVMTINEARRDFGLPTGDRDDQ